ncbi:hypothetical protein ACWFPY_05925 [Nocardia fluminea]
MNPYISGLFALGGVLLGALVTPFTQLALEKMREKRAAIRAKRVVASELLHIQLVLVSASEVSKWTPFGDLDAFLPTSVWRENRLTLATNVDDELFERLTIAYASLEADRAALNIASQMAVAPALSESQALSFKVTSYKLGQLRRKLVPSGGWLGADEVGYANANRLTQVAERFYQSLDKYTDDELRNADKLASVKKLGTEIGQLAEDMGDGGTLLGQINSRINQRLVGIYGS